MTNEHRDDAIDRLLSALQPHSRSVSFSACLDPEVLAAWIDNTLPESARAKAEAHTASCSRCQALLAAMARTSDAAAAATSVDRPRSLVFQVAPWIAALGTAVIAIVIWAGIFPQGDRRASQPASSAARETEAARLETPKEKSESSATPAVQKESERRAFADAAARIAPTDALAGRARNDTANAVPSAPARRQAKDALSGARVESKVRGEPPAQVMAGIPASAPTTLPGTPVPEAATAPPAAAARSPQPVPPPSTPVNERTQGEQRMADLRRAGAVQEQVRMSGQAGASLLQIPSPDSRIAWRVLNRTTVQRSTDGGATWTTEATGAESPLNAGSSPSPAVCWLVGAQGAVLLTLDSGRTWQRVQFPEEIDLVRVTAASADAAAVTAANGRTFATSDGGKSWR